MKPHYQACVTKKCETCTCAMAGLTCYYACKCRAQCSRKSYHYEEQYPDACHDLIPEDLDILIKLLL